MSTIIFESTHWTSEREMWQNKQQRQHRRRQHQEWKKTAWEERRMIVQKFQRFIYIRVANMQTITFDHSSSNKRVTQRLTRGGGNMHRNIISQFLNEWTNEERKKLLIYINDTYDLFNINFQWQSTHTLHIIRCLSSTWSSAVNRHTLYHLHWTIITFGSQCNRVVCLYASHCSFSRHFAPRHSPALALICLLILGIFDILRNIDEWHMDGFAHTNTHTTQTHIRCSRADYLIIFGISVLIYLNITEFNNMSTCQFFWQLINDSFISKDFNRIFCPPFALCVIHTHSCDWAPSWVTLTPCQTNYTNCEKACSSAREKKIPLSANTTFFSRTNATIFSFDR